MTRAEFLQVCALDKKQIHSMLKGQSFNTCFDFRREFQVGLANYSKNTGGRHDTVKDSALIHLHLIEKWLRQAYYTRRMPELLKQEPGLIYKGKNVVKSMIRQEWEKMISKAAY